MRLNSYTSYKVFLIYHVDIKHEITSMVFLPFGFFKDFFCESLYSQMPQKFKHISFVNYTSCIYCCHLFTKHKYGHQYNTEIHSYSTFNWSASSKPLALTPRPSRKQSISCCRSKTSCRKSEPSLRVYRPCPWTTMS